ncbi:EAL domain-containing protein [Aestuariibacter sp. AA17]|uniref:EAL domain-containing protein n=1 Tax=Fluctibacter corallii TaxID=2984329 RepID=A0ABT3A6W0_9ALTE|nr:EAL domain-containing protein [Aestuariibacter sp. AA17]MCV2884312.1 EAL domain-containing protein [Aestuariibacter sp. AA17]
MFKGIRAKSIFVSVFVTLLSATTVLYFSLREHEKLYKESEFQYKDALSDVLAEELVSEVTLGLDAYQFPSSLLMLDKYPTIKYAFVLDREGEKNHQYVNPQLIEDASTAETIAQRKFDVSRLGMSVVQNDLVAIKQIGEPNYPLGFLVVVSDYTTPLNSSTKRLLVKTLPALILVIMIAVLVSFWIHRHLLRQIINLSKFTQSIRKPEDYRLRFEVKGSDEVAELGQHINAMLQTIELKNQHSKEQQLNLKKLANFDLLTELPNRQSFMDRLRGELARAKRAKRNLAILFLDLDNFKEINDSYGHEVGDELLIKVSERLQSELREGDILARLGGDEFLILIPEFSDSMGLGRVAERLLAIMQPGFIIRGWELNSGVSIGIADARSAEYNVNDIVRNADMAMYKAKELGRGRYAFFIESLLEQSIRKIKIANALATAIELEELTIFYQAKVNNGEKICGFEALVRWNSKSEGMISPAEFIPIAEQSGRVTAISRWVIRQVFKDHVEIARITQRPTTVAINLSAYDLKEPGLVLYIQELLVAYDINPAGIEFEVTESAYLDNFKQATEVLSALRKLGFSIALDDFGTGYSSLSYLAQIKVDTIKIDRAFVWNIDQSLHDTKIIETIFDLAKALHLDICAEGVETPAQADFLISRGCHQLQGYYYAKPLPLEALESKITAFI